MTEARESEFLISSYLRAKSVWKGLPARRRKGKRAEGTLEGRPFGAGRDPKTLVDVLATIALDMGWSVELDQARVIEEWPDFAGASTAEHTTVIGISNGVLQVQCDSTTWATELRRLRGEMLTRLLREYPDAEIRDLRFMAPGAPSWRHGPRTVRGRGPRDTYG
jgi:predicted nucleic acid-binding Zn ribbon protein